MLTPTTTHEKKCLVCGASPTVRSHLFPKALALRIRGKEKNLVAGDSVRTGVQFSQSGLWDNGIVCREHEEAFSTADDYTVRLCRRLAREIRSIPNSSQVIVPNPRPDLLLRFAAGTIWRHVVSRHGRTHDLELGKYRELFEDHLFRDAEFGLELLVGRSNVRDPHGRPMEFGLAPYQSVLFDWKIWHFSIGGMDFYLKTDDRPFPLEWSPFLANGNDPLVMGVVDAMNFHEIPILQPILQNMMTR